LRFTGKKYKDLSDEDLMRLVGKRDDKAFEEIYNRYNKRLFYYFFKMLWKDREKAEDFVHDIFTKIVNNPDIFDPNRPFKTWVFSVANNMCKNEYKKNEVRKTQNEFEFKEEIMPSENGLSGAKQHDNQVFNQSLNREISKLDEKHKSTFLLRYKEELSIKEISESLGISEGTVKSRLFNTIKKISVGLKNFDSDQQNVQITVS
jgi:RNA polymerase sigma-70 factor (ECF subfamily)